jgi:hypothetical protein
MKNLFSIIPARTAATVAVPGIYLGGLKQGPVQMNVFRASIDFTMMPTGYVVRSTTLNMTSIDATAQ